MASSLLGILASLLGILSSLLGILASLLAILRVVLPPDRRFSPLKFLNWALNCVSSCCYFEITENDANTNELYNAVQLYLSSFVSASGSHLSLTHAISSSATTFGLSNNNCINDVFDGVTVQWEHVVTQRQSCPLPDEKRSFRLQIRKCHKDLDLDSYLDYIIDKANDIRLKNQERLLYSISRRGSLNFGGHLWESVPFKNRTTFDTLAMDPEKKGTVMEDLRNFVAGKAFYQQMGLAWKRRYLLYGAPRTGKSNMIAAMANFLGYDIYDLELTKVQSKSEFLNLLMKTSSKSIVVIKNIDCLVNLSNRSKIPQAAASQAAASQSYYSPDAPDAMCGSEDGNNNTITFSGLLNFPDGLWSCCGGERVFVFTTNHIEKLDLALLQSSQMDMHICMS